ncbi:MAG: hypothetical protein ACAH24_17400 [Hyphomicrobiaceae bacterium]
MRLGRGLAWLCARGAAAVLLALLAGGCTHERKGPVGQHYLDFATRPPRNNTVYVCHAYGCRKQTPFRFTDEDIAALKTLMAKTRKADTPAEERRAIAYAIGWMERRTGDVIGTKADRPGMDFSASGDPTQQDCVDEATNTTSYLLILERNAFLRHHVVGTPFSKENLLRGVAGWPHWTAVIKEHVGGQKWAVDSWIYANGENPAVVETEKWYIASLEELPAATR